MDILKIFSTCPSGSLHYAQFSASIYSALMNIFILYNFGYVCGNFCYPFPMLLSLTLCLSQHFLQDFYGLLSCIQPQSYQLGNQVSVTDRSCFPPCYFRLLGHETGISALEESDLKAKLVQLLVLESPLMLAAASLQSAFHRSLQYCH